MRTSCYYSHWASLLVSLSLALGGCRKESAVNVPLVLLAPVTITPSSRTMQRGDTLWLEANFSDSLRDYNSGKRYRLRPQDMVLAMGIVLKKLTGVGQTPTGIANTFRLVEREGHMSLGGTTTGLFSLNYDGHSYRGKFGLIPTQAGITSISLLLSPDGGPKEFGRFIPFIQLPPDAQGREQKAVLDDMYFIINDGKANNYDLYRQAYTVDPQASGLPDEKLIYVKQSTFTVEVK